MTQKLKKLNWKKWKNKRGSKKSWTLYTDPFICQSLSTWPFNESNLFWLTSSLFIDKSIKSIKLIKKKFIGKKLRIELRVKGRKWKIANQETAIRRWNKWLMNSVINCPIFWSLSFIKNLINQGKIGYFWIVSTLEEGKNEWKILNSNRSEQYVEAKKKMKKLVS